MPDLFFYILLSHVRQNLLFYYGEFFCPAFIPGQTAALSSTSSRLRYPSCIGIIPLPYPQGKSPRLLFYLYRSSDFWGANENDPCPLPPLAALLFYRYCLSKNPGGFPGASLIPAPEIIDSSRQFHHLLHSPDHIPHIGDASVIMGRAYNHLSFPGGCKHLS